MGVGVLPIDAIPVLCMRMATQMIRGVVVVWNTRTVETLQYKYKPKYAPHILTVEMGVSGGVK